MGGLGQREGHTGVSRSSDGKRIEQGWHGWGGCGMTVLVMLCVFTLPLSPALHPRTHPTPFTSPSPSPIPPPLPSPLSSPPTSPQIAQATSLAEQGDFAAAEKLFIDAKEPERAVDMYK